MSWIIVAVGLESYKNWPVANAPERTTEDMKRMQEDFDEAVIKIAKRVLKGLHDMHYKRSNLVDQMPIPKSKTDFKIYLIIR